MSTLKTLVLSIVLSVLSLGAYAAGPYPETNAASDIKVATSNLEDGQLMLLSFGANWCYNCRNLSKGLHSASLESWVEDNFEVVKVNVGSSGQNADTVKTYNNPTQFGIPAIVIADAEGKFLAKVSANKLIPAIRGGDAALKSVLEEAYSDALARL